jgi:hypothetical protein
MADKINNNVETKPIGFAPILQHYFQKCCIADIIDQNVPQKSVIMIRPVRKFTARIINFYRFWMCRKNATLTNICLILHNLVKIGQSERSDNCIQNY